MHGSETFGRCAGEYTSGRQLYIHLHTLVLKVCINNTKTLIKNHKLFLPLDFTATPTFHNSRFVSGFLRTRCFWCPYCTLNVHVCIVFTRVRTSHIVSLVAVNYHLLYFVAQFSSRDMTWHEETNTKVNLFFIKM